MFFQLCLLRIGQILLVSLGVYQQQQNRLLLVVIVINHPSTTALASAWPRYANFAQTSGALDDSTRLRSPGQKFQHVVKTGLTQQLTGRIFEGTERDQRLHQL
jgi:hypothetical protein